MWLSCLAGGYIGACRCEATVLTFALCDVEQDTGHTDKAQLIIMQHTPERCWCRERLMLRGDR